MLGVTGKAEWAGVMASLAAKEDRAAFPKGDQEGEGKKRMGGSLKVSGMQISALGDTTAGGMSLGAPALVERIRRCNGMARRSKFLGGSSWFKLT